MITLLLTLLTVSAAHGGGTKSIFSSGNLKLRAAEPPPLSLIPHARLGQVPYLIQIKILATNRRCAGALVDGVSLNQVIVTTADCVTMPLPSTNLVDLNTVQLSGGKFFRENYYFYEQVTQPSKIVRHPSWNRNNQINDLAVIFLRKEFTLNRLVNTILLPSPTLLYPDTNAPLIMAGWGLEKESEALQIFRLPTITWDDCYNAYSGLNGASKLSAGGTLCGWDRASEGTDGICKGDWGSPAKAFDREGYAYLVGIFCWTEAGCGKQNYPVLFQKISFYTEWILETSKQDPRL